MSDLLGFDEPIDTVDEGVGSDFEVPYDEPEGLSAPNESDFCIGHEGVEKKLLDFINSGAMPHAIVFSGLEGIGKATMAFRFARYMLKNGMVDANQDSLFGDAPSSADTLTIDPDDPVFSKVASGGHPDFKFIERPFDERKGKHKGNIDVETARKVAPFLRMTASDGGWRVVIIDDADTMNRNAQNAILKILEEPPSNALLILIAHRPGALIPTIRSRCRVVAFDALADEVLDQLMQKAYGNELSPQDKEILKALAVGSIGQCHNLLENDGLQTIKEVLALLTDWPQIQWSAVHHLSDQIGRAGQEASYRQCERTLCGFVHALVQAKARGWTSLALDTGLSEKMLQNKSLEELIELYDSLSGHFRQVEISNLDKRQGVLSAFKLLCA